MSNQDDTPDVHPSGGKAVVHLGGVLSPPSSPEFTPEELARIPERDREIAILLRREVFELFEALLNEAEAGQ